MDYTYYVVSYELDDETKVLHKLQTKQKIKRHTYKAKIIESSARIFIQDIKTYITLFIVVCGDTSHFDIQTTYNGDANKNRFKYIWRAF